MRRNSVRARQLVEHWSQQGTTYRGHAPTGRDVEQLSKLLPLSDQADKVFDHYLMEIDKLGYKPGSNGKEIALRLLARGLPTTLGCTSIETYWREIDKSWDWVADGGQVPFELMETIPLVRPMVQGLRRALADVPEGGRVDYAGAMLVETPASREATVLALLKDIALGKKDKLDADLLLDITHSPASPLEQLPGCYYRESMPDELDNGETVLSVLSDIATKVPAIIKGAPPGQLAYGALYVNTMILLCMPKLDERRRELIAAAMSPLMVGLFAANWAAFPAGASAFLRITPAAPKEVTGYD